MAASISIDCPGSASGVVSGLVYPAQAGPAAATLVLAPGAGGPHTHPYLVGMAGGLASRGIEVVTFNFPYAEDGRRAPDRLPVLESTYRAVIRHVRGRTTSHPLYIGGKSMGGRVASTVAAAGDDDLRHVAGLVFLGYPFHPPGRRDARRLVHLPAVGRPMLFLQGSRDPFGSPDEVMSATRRLAEATVEIVDGGDHSLRVRKKWPVAQADVDAGIQARIAAWIREWSLAAR
jgi:hypothetical protein